jgi:YggT family protein
LILLIKLVNFVLNIYTFLIIARAIISWVNPDPYNQVVRILDKFTEPVLYPIRKLLRRVTGNLPMDFSPIIAIVLIQIVGSFLIRILNSFI